jgi:hypothetical protein
MLFGHQMLLCKRVIRIGLFGKLCALSARRLYFLLMNTRICSSKTELLQITRSVQAIEEAGLLWPDVKIKCTVSLGTGLRRNSLWRVSCVLLGRLHKQQTIVALVASATQTENTHKDLQKSLGQEYFRLTVPIPPVDLAEPEPKVLAALKQMAREHFLEATNRLNLQRVASILTIPTWIVAKKDFLAAVRANYALWTNVDKHEYIQNATTLFMSFWYCGDKF